MTEMARATKTQVNRMIDQLIKTSSKAPPRWNQAKIKAQEATKGIREKAKKSKKKVGFWFLVLVIIVPILIIAFLVLTRKVEIPLEEPEYDGRPFDEV